MVILYYYNGIYVDNYNIPIVFYYLSNPNLKSKKFVRVAIYFYFNKRFWFLLHNMAIVFRYFKVNTS